MLDWSQEGVPLPAEAPLLLWGPRGLTCPLEKWTPAQQFPGGEWVGSEDRAYPGRGHTHKQGLGNSLVPPSLSFLKMGTGPHLQREDKNRMLRKP